MENVEVGAALAAAAAAQPRPLLARLRRGRRLIGVGFLLSASSVAGLVCTTIPGHAANPYVAALCFPFLMSGLAGILLGVAAPDLPAVERVVARLEEML